MFIEVGDVIRLGRVCYIVKESSIELGEQALKMCESYATNKNKRQWDNLIRNQSSSDVAKIEESGTIIDKSSHKSLSQGPPQQADAYDAIEDYFNTALAGADDTQMKENNKEGASSEFIV